MVDKSPEQCNIGCGFEMRPQKEEAMSSSGERRPSAGLLARVKEAAENPYLVWLAERAPSPRQTAIVCQILGLTNEEEKNTKAVAWLKKHQPVMLEVILTDASKPKSTFTSKEEQAMRVTDQKRFFLMVRTVMDNIRKKSDLLETSRSSSGSSSEFPKRDGYHCVVDTSFLKHRWEVILIAHSRYIYVYNRSGKGALISEWIRVSSTFADELERLAQESGENHEELLFQLERGLRDVVMQFDMDFQKRLASWPDVARRLIEEKIRA